MKDRSTHPHTIVSLSLGGVSAMLPLIHATIVGVAAALSIRLPGAIAVSKTRVVHLRCVTLVPSFGLRVVWGLGFRALCFVPLILSRKHGIFIRHAE